MPRKTSKPDYENNPFFIASSGITKFANMAQSIFVVFIALALLGLLSNGFSPDVSQDSIKHAISTVSAWSLHDWLVAIGSGSIIGLAWALISALLSGVSAYTSAMLAHGRHVSLKKAFREAFDNLWSYLWLQAIICIRLFLWSLLFIIPGVIMYFRYSLASVAFFDESKNLRGNAAINESLRLTKNGWITTYAANVLFNFLTLFAITNIITTSVNAVLYRQFDAAGDKKPQTHWLSWLTLVGPFAVLGVLVFFAATAAVIVTLLGIKSH